MADEKKPASLDEVLDHANALFVKARNVAIAAAATVLAIGGVAISIIDQWNTARAHMIEQKTKEIDEHLVHTDKEVVGNAKRLDAAGAPDPQ